MRKLSTIDTVLDVQPVLNSDNLDVVTVRGWEVVTKRGEFKIGDLCVYFEIDSILPNVPLFSFLESKRFRIKTIKLRGQISQGLVLPISNIEEEFGIGPFDDSLIGTCLDSEIGVKHIDELSPDNPLYIKSNFPSFIPKTDQERIQNIPAKKLINKEYEVSIKLDGSSMTVFFNNGQYGVCSKNRLLDDTDLSNFTNTANKYNLSETLKEYGANIAIQGELIGEGIQKNRENIKGHDYYVYNIFNIDSQEYLSVRQKNKVIENLGLKSVPLLYDTPFVISNELDKAEILKMAEGPSLFSKNREGLVFKSYDNSISFKAISNKYLLKN